MTSTIASNGAYASAASQARQATEKSAYVFKKGAKSFTDQLDMVMLPRVDLTRSVTNYFQYLQMAVDFNRDLALQWAELLTTLSGSVRQQAQQVNDIVKDQTDTVANLTVKQAEKTEKAAKEQTDKVEQAAREQAEKVEQAAREQAEKARIRETQRVEREEAKKAQQQAEEAEKAEKAKTRETQRVEREKAKKAQTQAREAYDGLTKTELSDQLAGRGLPKTGNVEDLIERLVIADTE
jgi:hypothetical protein